MSVTSAQRASLADARGSKGRLPIATSPLVRGAAAAYAACYLLLAGCSEDDSRYHKVAQGRYAEIWQSVDLDGRVCPEGAAETDRQIEELASALRVSVPDDFRVIARIEPDDATVKEACGTVDVSACLLTANDAAGSPLLISPAYLRGHETVHAVQRLRGGDWSHAALREGEAVMFADLADSIGTLGFCSPGSVSDGSIREVLDDPSSPGAYSVFHEIVVRVYQDYGPEAFDALWAASADDPSTDGLLAAFEAVLGTTLFELMQRHSLTCRDRIPGCAGLERFSLTSNALTVSVPRSCDDATSGLEPNEATPESKAQYMRVFRSFVLEIDQAGDLRVAFSGANGIVNVGACDGFDEVHNYGDYTAAFDRGAYPLDAGLYRVFVLGNSDGPAAEAQFEFTPSG